MSTYESTKSHVMSVLNDKNIQKLPRTLDSLLTELQYAEKFSEKSEYAQKRAYKIGISIEKALVNLASRDMKSNAEVLREDMLDNDQLIKRALIHTSKVSKLAALRQYYANASAELERQINASEQKVPFAQRAEFSKLLVELQGQGNETLANED
jgi:hypothetical protein